MFQVDVYDLLSNYKSYLISKNFCTNLTIKQRLVTAKNFLEYYDIEISPRKFKLKVKIPKSVRRNKEALTKEDIVKILENCTNFKLKTFLMCLAATGMRAGEACSVRLMDIDFDNCKINIRGEYTKTKEDRFVFMTDELIQQLQAYLTHKYHTRTRYYSYSKITKEKTMLSKPVLFTPPKKDTDLVFGSYFDIGEKQVVRSIYTRLITLFDKTLDQLNISFEDSTNNNKRHRRKITFHSFRRWVKSVISDLGYGDYSEWFIGHKVSTYYRKSDKEKFELFKKIMPYLTYLDQTGLERKGADLTNRLETMERENRELRDNMNKIMEMIQENPKLAQVKPDVLIRKKGK